MKTGVESVGRWPLVLRLGGALSSCASPPSPAQLRVVYFDASGETREASAGDDGGSSQWCRMARGAVRLFALYSA